MRKFTAINESYNNVGVGYKNLNSELIYLTENGEQVGSLILIYEGNIASVFSVAVLEKHRGKKFGKKLMESAISKSKEKGFKTMDLNTEVDNKVANSLYVSMGFELTGLKDGYNNYKLKLN